MKLEECTWPPLGFSHVSCNAWLLRSRCSVAAITLSVNTSPANKPLMAKAHPHSVAWWSRRFDSWLCTNNRSLVKYIAWQLIWLSLIFVAINERHRTIQNMPYGEKKTLIQCRQHNPKRNETIVTWSRKQLSNKKIYIITDKVLRLCFTMQTCFFFICVLYLIDSTILNMAPWTKLHRSLRDRLTH
jgi:hypothetical protein